MLSGLAIVGLKSSLAPLVATLFRIVLFYELGSKNNLCIIQHHLIQDFAQEIAASMNQKLTFRNANVCAVILHLTS